MREGSIFTFYSYKGGVGRSFALANIGALLSRWGYKVLCIDWDLEAPGLHLYFQKWLTGTAHRRGLTELIQAYADGKAPRWRTYTTEVRFPRAKVPLTLMGAGAQDESYVERMQALDWGRLYEKHDLGSHLEDLRGRWKKDFDFILIDSRTGITDVGSICTAQLPDYLVLLFTANEQSLHGAVKVVDMARESRSRLPFDRAKLLVLPVITRFEVRIEYALAQRWLGIFAKALDPLFGEWAHREVTTPELLNFTRIPSFPYWSFGERLPVIEKGVDDPEDIGYNFETLAALVAHKLSYSEVLVNNRDSFVDSAKKGPIVGQDSEESNHTSRASRVFISYSHRDAQLLEELETHLKPLVRDGVIQVHDKMHVPDESVGRSTINPHLEAADIIMLLISSDYLASDYAYGAEIQHAIERDSSGQAAVIPIILRPTNWSWSPLAKFQALPKDAKPVTVWKNRDEAWAQVVADIRNRIKQFRPGRGKRP
jgi:cellulose biosynthesis protein BcsQ